MHIALSETKLKGKIVFGEVKRRKSGLNERVRAREGVSLLVKGELERYVKERRKVFPRLMWIRMTLLLPPGRNYLVLYYTFWASVSVFAAALGALQFLF